jgi:putative membrane protein
MIDEPTEMNEDEPRSRGVDAGAGFVVRPTSDSHFSWIRTRLAADSTLMGWMRLGTTLIGFGFTIVQFFEKLENMENAKAALAPSAPYYLGLSLIFSGVFGVLVATRQYIAFVRYLHSKEFEPVAMRSELPVNLPAVAIALALAFIGAIAFVTVMFRLA